MGATCAIRPLSSASAGCQAPAAKRRCSWLILPPTLRRRQIAAGNMGRDCGNARYQRQWQTRTGLVRCLCAHPSRSRHHRHPAAYCNVRTTEAAAIATAQSKEGLLVHLSSPMPPLSPVTPDGLRRLPRMLWLRCIRGGCSISAHLLHRRRSSQSTHHRGISLPSPSRLDGESLQRCDIHFGLGSDDGVLARSISN